MLLIIIIVTNRLLAICDYHRDYQLFDRAIVSRVSQGNPLIGPTSRLLFVCVYCKRIELKQKQNIFEPFLGIFAILNGRGLVVVVVAVVFYYCDMGEDWYNCYTLKNKHSVDSPGHSWPLGHNCMLICNCEL